MTAPDQGRRRFLTGLVTLAGMAGAGVLGWRTRPDPPLAPTAAASATTTVPPATTQAPPSSTTSTTSSTTTTTAPVAVQIAAICGDAWGAKDTGGDFTNHSIERLTVHHTAALLSSNARAPARVRQHQEYHLSLGWPDLAYHFVVDANGHVYEGRPVDAVGDTGTEYDPTGHFLVCCEGDFDQQTVPGSQVSGLVDVLAWASMTFEVDPGTIGGHRDYASTSCPGAELYPLIESGELEARVRDRLRQGVVTLEVECGDVAAARVAAIEAGTI